MYSREHLKSNPDENSDNIFCLLAPRVGRVSLVTEHGFSFDCFAHHNFHLSATFSLFPPHRQHIVAQPRCLSSFERKRAIIAELCDTDVKQDILDGEGGWEVKRWKFFSKVERLGRRWRKIGRRKLIDRKLIEMKIE